MDPPLHIAIFIFIVGSCFGLFLSHQAQKSRKRECQRRYRDRIDWRIDELTDKLTKVQKWVEAADCWLEDGPEQSPQTHQHRIADALALRDPPPLLQRFYPRLYHAKHLAKDARRLLNRTTKSGYSTGPISMDL